MTVSFTVTGLAELVSDLRAAPGRVGQKVAAGVRKSAADVEAGAKARAPVDTGNLRNSITTSVEGDGRSGAVTATVGPTANYGGYVEYGTSRMGPQPYLGPAFDQVVPSFVQAMEDAAGGILGARP